LTIDCATPLLNEFFLFLKVCNFSRYHTFSFQEPFLYSYHLNPPDREVEMRKTYVRYLILVFVLASFFFTSDILFAQQFGPGAGPGPGGALAQTTLTTFETDDFSGSGICAFCHSSLTD
jgi:hypothetical protein